MDKCDYCVDGPTCNRICKNGFKLSPSRLEHCFEQILDDIRDLKDSVWKIEKRLDQIHK
jgi:hypothetical protein